MIIKSCKNNELDYERTEFFICYDEKSIVELNTLISDMHSHISGGDYLINYIEDRNNIDVDMLTEKFKNLRGLVLCITKPFLDNYDPLSPPIEYMIADKIGLPIIPIVMDDTDLSDFTSKVGRTLHGISCKDNEYSAKLREQLNYHTSTNIIERNKKINEKAFSKKIFLSYRKDNLDEVEKFIEWFYSIPEFQMVSIWYDTFLTTGEFYDSEIEKALDEADVFILFVTPDVIKKNSKNEPNFVAAKEYPYACGKIKSIIENNIKKIELPKPKTIISIEAVPTDRDVFSEMYPNAAPISINDIEKLTAELHKCLSLPKSINAESLYFLGSAYLYGIGVPQNDELSKRMFATIAEHESMLGLAAANALVKIFNKDNGTAEDNNYALSYAIIAYNTNESLYGTKNPDSAFLCYKVGMLYTKIKDFDNAITWLLKAIGQLEINAESSGDMDYETLLKIHEELCMVFLYLGDDEFLKHWVEKALKTKNFINNYYLINDIFERLGSVFEDYEKLDLSVMCYEVSLDMNEMIYGPDVLNNADILYFYGDKFRKFKYSHNALNCYEKCYAIQKKVLGEQNEYTLNCADQIITECVLTAADYAQKSEFPNSIERLNRALDLLKIIPARNDTFKRAIEIYDLFGLVYFHAGYFFDAQKYFFECLALQHECFGKNSPEIETTHKKLAVINHDAVKRYFEVDRNFKLVEYIGNAIKIIEYSPACDNSDELIFLQANLAAVLNNA